MSRPKKKEINLTKDSVLSLLQEIYNELVEQRSTAIRVQNKMLAKQSLKTNAKSYYWQNLDAQQKMLPGKPLGNTEKFYELVRKRNINFDDFGFSFLANKNVRQTKRTWKHFVNQTKRASHTILLFAIVRVMQVKQEVF